MREYDIVWLVHPSELVKRVTLTLNKHTTCWHLNNLPSTAKRQSINVTSSSPLVINTSTTARQQGVSTTASSWFTLLNSRKYDNHSHQAFISLTLEQLCVETSSKLRECDSVAPKGERWCNDDAAIERKCDSVWTLTVAKLCNKRQWISTSLYFVDAWTTLRRQREDKA